MTVFVHFGMHKTGSTALQGALSELHIPGIFYPRTRTRDHNGLLASVFRHSPSLHLLRQGFSEEQIDERRSSSRKALKHIMESRPHGTATVLSAEVLFSFYPSELHALRTFLVGYDPEVKAIGFIRAPSAYMASSFQEQLKRGVIEFNLEFLYPKYQKRIEKFDRIFGNENVLLIPYKPENPKSIADSFLARIGLSHRVGQVSQTNRSLSRDAVSLLYAFRKFGNQLGVGNFQICANERMIKLLEALPGPPFCLHRELMSPFLQQHEADLRWLEERMGEVLVDVQPDQPTAIRSEDDLLEFSSGALHWLGVQCAQFRLPASGLNNPRGVSAAMEALAVALATDVAPPAR